jgi:hypothetical protein
MKKYILLSIVIIGSIISSAQNSECGFSLKNADLVAYQARVEALFNGRANQMRPDCIKKTLSVHVHLIGENSDEAYADIAEITASIDSLNAAFEPICLNFEVCKTEYHYNSVYFDGLIDTNYARVYKLYADTGVINLFFIESFDDGSLTGVSEFFPSNFFALSTTNNKALIHHMGHFLGLLHTHNGGGELVNRSNCETAGDFLCDTEADPNLNNDCGYAYDQTDANGDYYTPPLFNHMSNSSPGCRKEFTPMQYMVMIDYILNVRNYLH